MPSFLAQLAAARLGGGTSSAGGAYIKKGPVTIYDPRRRGVVTKGPVQQQQPRETRFIQRRLDDNEAQDRAAYQREQLQQIWQRNQEEDARQQQQQQQKELQPDLPWWKNALGVVLGNVLTPLGVLGTGRRAAEVGISEFAQNAPPWLQQAVRVAGSPGPSVIRTPGAPNLTPGTLVTAQQFGGVIDPEQAAKAEGSNLDKILNPKSEFGYGQLLNPEAGTWTNRFTGLTGDVLFDPLTYATGGAYRAARGGTEATKALEEATLARQVAQAAEYPRGVEEGLAKEAAARWRAHGLEAPIHGRQGRANLISETIARNPELSDEMIRELQRGGERGFNTLSAEARQVLGVAEPGVRIRGFQTRLPGTGGITRGGSAILGAGRAGINEIPGLTRVLKGPKALEEVTRAFTRGGEVPADEAKRLAAFYIGYQAYRSGHGVAQAGGNRTLAGLARNVFNRVGLRNMADRMSESQIRQMLVDSELSNEMTPINDALQEIRNIARRVSGDPMPSSIPDEKYVPHLMSPSARRWMHENPNDPGVLAYKNYMEKSGTKVLTEDLLEGSPFVEHARVFKPNADGTPGIYDFGEGRQLVVERGDIGELNQKFAELFPGFKGKFYQDDPIHILESYVGSLAKTAGKGAAIEAVRETGTPLVKTIEGDLATALEGRNAILGAQHPMADIIRQGYDPNVGRVPEGGIGPVLPVPEPVPAPTMPDEIAGVRLEDYFASTTNKKATQELRSLAKGPARQYVKAIGADVKPQVEAVRSTLGDVRRTMLAPLQKEEKRLNNIVSALDTAVAASRKQLDELAVESTSSHEGLTSFVVNIRNEIDEADEVLADHQRYFRYLSRRERRQVVKKLRGARETLRDLQVEARRKIATLPPAARQAAKELEGQLYEPLRRARSILLHAEAEAVRGVGGRPSPRALEQARQVMAGNDEEYWARLRQQYSDARAIVESKGKGLPRTASGRLTADAKRQMNEALRVVNEFEAGRVPNVQAAAGGAFEEDATRLFGDEAKGIPSLDQQILDASDPVKQVRNPWAARDLAALEEERQVLRAKFEPGGEHYAEMEARRAAPPAKAPLGEYQPSAQEVADKARIEEIRKEIPKIQPETAKIKAERAALLKERREARLRITKLDKMIKALQRSLDVSNLTPEKQALFESQHAAFTQEREQLQQRLGQIGDRVATIRYGDPKLVGQRANLHAELKTLRDKFAGKGADLPVGEYAAARAAHEAAVEEARVAGFKGTRRGEGFPEVTTTATGKRIPTGGREMLGSRKYDVDEEELFRLQEEVRRRGAAVPATLRAQLRAQQAKFNPGGEHYAETYARQTLMQEAEVEHALKNVDPKLRGEVERLKGVVSRQERRVKEQAAGLRRFAETYPESMGRNVETYAQREADITGRLEGMGAPEVGPPAPLGHGFDVERDLNIPERVATQRDAIMGPLLEQQEIRGQLHDVVTEHATERLRILDEENIGLQAELARDLQDTTVLKAKRDQITPLIPVLKDVDPRKGSVKELSDAVDAIAGVAAANPLLDNQSLNATESLLQHEADQLVQLGKKRALAANARAMTRAAENKTLAPVMLTMLNDNWRMIYEGTLKTGDTIVDAKLYQMFENLLVLDKQPRWFGRVFNSLTNLFKTYATLSPGFHVRNALSGIFMNTSDGVALQAQLEGSRLWGRYMKEGDSWLQKQSPRVQQAFAATTGSGAGGRFTEAGVASLTGDIKTPWLQDLYNRAASNRVTRFSQRWGERVEGALRLGMALDSIDRGETVAEALARITRVHFDYSQTSQLDDVAKRFIPFWTYMSRNLPLQVSQMWTKPGLYANYESFVRNFSTQPEQYTPQYWLEQGGFNTGAKVPENNLPILGDASNLPIYLQPDIGYNRLRQDVAAMTSPSKLFAQGNPLLTALPEYASKSDFYTGRHFDQTDFEAQPGLFGLPYKAVAALTDVFGANNLNEQGEVSSNLVNVMRGLIPILDREQRLLPATDEGKQRQAESILRFLGVPGRTLTPQQQKSELFRRYYDQLDEVKRRQAMAQRAAEAQAS